jgi:hypothetical protein
MLRIAYGDCVITVTQDPTMAAMPNLIRFHKANAQRKLLDQIAEWTGDGWDASRWVPRPPAIPQRIIDQVEQMIRGQS